MLGIKCITIIQLARSPSSDNLLLHKTPDIIRLEDVHGFAINRAFNTSGTDPYPDLPNPT